MSTATYPAGTRIKGGSFLLEVRQPQDVFTPEDLTDQHRLIRHTAEEFMAKEVLPRTADMEDPAKKYAACRELIRKAGELGLTGADVPSQYGGLGLDKASSLVVAEKTSQNAAFSATVGAHTGIGTLPIVFFGNEEQKQKYLPRLVSGETVAAYCLSEATSGSDALAAQTKATQSPDGRFYLLSGTKMWTTNGGFADLYTVFAKVDGEKFTAFLMERSRPGVSVGAEEKKMGIHGSSTTPVILEEARVPVENVLGEVGKGHLIAFNILNVGRLKLGSAAVGAAKTLVGESVKWAKQRTAFGHPIADFGLVKEKLGEMVLRAYAGESVVYRTTGLIDRLLEGLVSSSGEARSLQAIQEYAVECSISKVFGVEALDYVVDQAVQIYGGYGYSSDYPIERAYRDSRVNRIFEGTDEINRLLIVDMLLKRSLKGTLPLMPAAQKLLDEVLSLQPSGSQGDEEGQPLATEARLLAGARKVLLLVAGTAIRKYATALDQEQEIIGALSNVVIEIYAMESCLLRTLKNAQRTDASSAANRSVEASLTQAYIRQAIDRVEVEARRALARIAAGDTLRVHLSVLGRFLKRFPLDGIDLRRRVADRALELDRYPFWSPA